MAKNTKSTSMMKDQDKMADILSNQKFITTNYNTFTNECANNEVRSAMMNILNEEHQIQSEIFNTMQQRGWYTTKKATQKEINQIKQELN